MISPNAASSGRPKASVRSWSTVEERTGPRGSTSASVSGTSRSLLRKAGTRPSSSNRSELEAAHRGRLVLERFEQRLQLSDVEQLEDPGGRLQEPPGPPRPGDAPVAGHQLAQSRGIDEGHSPHVEDDAHPPRVDRTRNRRLHRVRRLPPHQAARQLDDRNKPEVANGDVHAGRSYSSATLDASISYGVRKRCAAAGVEPAPPQNANWLMARDFLESSGVLPSIGEMLEAELPTPLVRHPRSQGWSKTAGAAPGAATASAARRRHGLTGILRQSGVKRAYQGS